MAEIKLVKKYPNICDEDVTKIFQEGYLKGFENGRKNAIPIEWIEKQIEQYYDDGYNSYGKALNIMLADWRAENETTSEN